MTAVYKYADALIKCFATAISTGLLLYIAPLLFDIRFSFLVVPGTCVVFLATWIYMEASPKPVAEAVMTPAPILKEQSFITRAAHALTPHRVVPRWWTRPLNHHGIHTSRGMLTYWRIHNIPSEPNDSTPTATPGLEITSSAIANINMQFQQHSPQSSSRLSRIAWHSSA